MRNALNQPRAAGLLVFLGCALVLADARAGSSPAGEAPYQKQKKGRGMTGVYKAQITPNWFAGNTRFWYRNDLRGGTREFILIDAVQGQRQPAFDHQKLAAALSTATGEKYQADRLPFTTIEFVEEGKAVRFSISATAWKCDLSTYACTKTGAAPPPTASGGVDPRRDKPGGSPAPLAGEDDPERAESPFPDGLAPEGEQPVALQQPRGRPAAGSPTSPDKKWTAFIKDHNVFVRSADGTETQLSKDGKEGLAYGMLAWSPDSKALVAFRIEPGERKEVYLIESSPPGGGRAKMRSRPYALPGDRFTAYELNLFDLTTQKQIKPQLERTDFGTPRLRWKSDGQHFTYEKVDRGHQRFRLIEVDAHTGTTRNIIDEKTKTFIWTAHAESRGGNVTYLAKTDEIIYASEQDGWRHLYLYDSKAGTLKNQITKGEWVVRSIEHIDEAKREIWFRASGKNPGQDPYLIHHYRIRFDGTGLVALTEGDGNHTVRYSPDEKFLIDTYSRVDMAPAHELRRVSDGKLVCELERADVTELRATGWEPPEVFVSKGRDGKTDIWGIISRPRDFDPKKKYPVIEYIYAGPQSAFVPKTFSSFSRFGALANLGFVVVQTDGMGTAHRSKAFHDVCWHNLKDAGFPDRILWHQAVAKKYPWYDISRVGVYGTSAGGQNAMGAVLFHGDFYKAAVAACGCHDNRMDKASWNEQWMGYPVGPQYAASSNVDNAHRLTGKLLLIVGEVDTNVPPESTHRVAAALIRAGKDFDYLFMPNVGHSGGGAYGTRRLQDFFVRHLQGREPPDRNAGPRRAEAKQEAAPKLPAELSRSLALRSVGPPLTSGRISDIAIDPRNRSMWYIASASGGLWKTVNRGTTWRPIFDRYGSYSLGCITIDPKNPDVLWLGTGENQSQRSVSFGDGVYKSRDAGETWERVGLPDSEHIAKILIDPRDTNVVYVASQGPLWADGGDRGLYKTTDGGKTWQAVLQISPRTGVTDIAFDPRNPDVIYAAAYQRRRHVGVLIGGGPEAGIFRSMDAGKTWTKLTKGLPAGDLGRIALAVSPQKPDIVYALVTAARKQSGFFRTADRGETWERQSSQTIQDPQYYGEIYPDPHKFDRVYVMDMRVQVTEDGGKKFRPMPWNIHVDHHAIAFDPTDPKYLLVGNDGGLYESHDSGRTWRHFNNLPLPQFYRVAVDNAVPFYNIYGGTQDNGTQGGPSRTANRVGIRTSEWVVVGGGDGMQPRVDPQDPDTIYVQSQYGALSRLDRRTSISVPIRPGGRTRDTTVRWSWDSPFIISPHRPTRLYFAGSRLFQSDNRGDAWVAVSPDLTRQIDRDKLEVMGRVWGPDAVSRNTFTSPYGVASALDESPLKEGLLYVGTDDGLVQVSEDNGKTWRKVERFPGVSELAYVSDLCPSRHDADTVYAAFNNYQRGDFRPYLLKSTDRGKTWASVAGDLPGRHPVWSVVEDHVNRDLLFAGTEFGLFFTVDGGKQWMPLRGGAPTIPFRDLEIQRREGDLVCATFGRGFFVLDDYTPLRHIRPETLAKEGVLFPPRKTYHYHERTYVRAASWNHTVPNPAFGAVLTYYLREPVPGGVVLTVTAADGKVVRRLNGPSSAGLHRVTWDLRPEGAAAPGGGGGRGGFQRRAQAPPVSPGTYKVQLGKRDKGDPTPLGKAEEVEVVAVSVP